MHSSSWPASSRSPNRLRFRLLGPLTLASLATGCGSQDTAPAPLDAPAHRRTGYLAEQLWEVGVATDAPTVSQGSYLGAGHGMVAWLIRSPCQHGTLPLSRPVDRGSGGPCPDPTRPSTLVNPDREVVYVGPNGDVWWLGMPRGSVLAHGNLPNRIVTRLPTSGRVLAACTSDGKTIVYADSPNRAVLRIHYLAGPDSARSLVVPAELATLGEPDWNGVQLGAAPGYPCILVVPRVGGVAVIRGDTAIWTGPFYEPLPAPPRVRRGFPWLKPFRTPPVVQRPGPLDATSFAGGIAILYQGAGVDGGRLVDLFDWDGQYNQTMILPHPVERIASTGTQLVTLSHRDKGWHLALYWFPGERTDSGPADTMSFAAPRPPISSP